MPSTGPRSTDASRSPSPTPPGHGRSSSIQTSTTGRGSTFRSPPAPAAATPVAAASPPGAPTGLVASAGNGTVGLSWTPPASDGGSPIVGYQIYRGTSSGAESLLDASDVSTYTDNAVANGTTYWYQVTAVTSAGEGPRSTEQSATPTGAAAVVPGAPTGLIATAGNAQVGLAWTA